MKCPECRKNGKDVTMFLTKASYSDQLQMWLMPYFVCSKCGTIVK